MKKLLSTEMEASTQQRARLPGPCNSLKIGKMLTIHSSSVKHLLMCKSSRCVTGAEDMTLEKSCLQLDKHSLLHLYSLRFHVKRLCICSVAHYLGIKEKRRKRKKKKLTCMPLYGSVFSYKYWIHEPLPMKVIHFNWNETQ